MKGITEFEKKYEQAIAAIAKSENVSCIDAREMLIYSCRQYGKNNVSEGSMMNFGKILGEEFDFVSCLSDFKDAIHAEAAMLTA